MIDIPAPPYSFGQAGATQPFSATFLRHANEAASLLEERDVAAAELLRALGLDEIVDFLAEGFFFGREAKVHAWLLSGRYPLARA